MKRIPENPVCSWGTLRTLCCERQLRDSHCLRRKAGREGDSES